MDVSKPLRIIIKCVVSTAANIERRVESFGATTIAANARWSAKLY
jgi:hypothetical protein